MKLYSANGKTPTLRLGRGNATVVFRRLLRLRLKAQEASNDYLLFDRSYFHNGGGDIVVFWVCSF